MEIFEIFPTAVGQFRLDGGFLPEELDCILQVEQRPNVGNRASVDSYIFDRPELHRLKAFATNCVQQYFELVYAPTDEVKPYITQSWVNFTDKGEYHARHTHQNSFISGVLYVQTDDAKDNISFYKNDRFPWDLPKKGWNGWNADGWRCAATTATALIFPSSLDHMVDNVVSDGTRVSIAFNSFLAGTLGSKNRFTELVLPTP